MCLDRIISSYSLSSLNDEWTIRPVMQTKSDGGWSSVDDEIIDYLEWNRWNIFPTYMWQSKESHLKPSIMWLYKFVGVTELLWCQHIYVNVVKTASILDRQTFSFCDESTYMRGCSESNLVCRSHYVAKVHCQMTQCIAMETFYLPTQTQFETKQNKI